MRGLNLLQTRLSGAGKTSWNKTSWARHQREALGQITASDDLRPVFPGSMLFNHILAPVEQPIPVAQTPLLAPDTRDVEFAFCNRRSVNNRLKNSVLVDFDGSEEQLPLEAIKKLIQIGSPVDRIAVLGKSAERTFSNLAGLDTRFLALKPDWKSIYAMHALYRDAEQVIFVDTMRVLDAAYSGCNATLVATEKFCRDPAFDLLLRQLQQVGCAVYSANSEKLLPSQNNYAFAVAENSVAHLKQQLSGEQQTDWLNFFTQSDESTDDHVANSKPVIPPPDMAAASIWSNVLDRRTRFMRKASKLREDPRSFFKDSNHSLLKQVSRVLPKRKAG